ncbi:sensor histidine kinase [Nocardia sp. NPDC052566]|uniref:sensor histidine kinase n=1 Tax=Nocardia sp. NPDC052566 TaxID=3364330 RepID=UPI0037C5B77D
MTARRWFAVRLLALPVGVAFVLTKGANDFDLLIAVVSSAVLVVGGRWPLPVLCAQAVLLVAAHSYGQSVGIGVKAWAAVALFEVALLRPYRELVAGIGVLSAAYLVIDVLTSTTGSVPLLYRLLLLVALPALGGAYIASLRQRAEDAERTAVLWAESARRAERESIARDLHDIIAHHVSAILVRVGMARTVSDLAPGETRQLLTDIHRTADSALKDLHELMNVLRDDTGALGVGSVLAEDRSSLPGLIEAMLANATGAGLRVRSAVDPAIVGVDGVRGLVLYRTIQEGITNAIKHSENAAALTLRADVQDGGTISVSLHNDRKAAPRGHGGFGLIGMRERLTSLGGTLDYGPDGAGWRLQATIPPRAAS